MSLPAYKVCAVPFCTSTTIKTPEKIFIHVPQMVESRQKWLQLAGRDLTTVSPKYSMYFCEDHFDLPKDMENYMKFKVMGTVGKIRMKPDCLPSKFICQQDQGKRTTSSNSQLIKRQKTTFENAGIKDISVPTTSSTTSSLSAESEHEREIKILKKEAIPTMFSWSKEENATGNTPEQNIGACRFCSTEGEHRSLKVEHILEGICENYSDMILECFNICITHQTTDTASSLICSTCASRLRDAHCFRQMVVRAEQGLLRGLASVQVQGNQLPDSKEPDPVQTVPVEVKKEPDMDIEEHGVTHPPVNPVSEEVYIKSESKHFNPDVTEPVEVKMELDIDIVEHGVTRPPVSRLPEGMVEAKNLDTDVKITSAEVKMEPEIDIVEHDNDPEMQELEEHIKDRLDAVLERLEPDKDDEESTVNTDPEMQRLEKYIKNRLDSLLEGLEPENDKDDEESTVNTDANNAYGCCPKKVKRFLEEYYDGENGVEEEVEDDVSDEELPVDRRRTVINLEEEDAFLEIGCGCRQKCLEKFNRNEVLKSRLDCLDLDIYCNHHVNHVHLMMLGVLSAIANTGPETSHSKLRQRNHIEFLYRGLPVCRKFFLFAHGFGVKKFKNVLKRFQENGLEAHVHNSTKTPPLMTEQRSDVVRFINIFSQQNSLVLPGRSLAQSMDLHILPSSMNRTSVYEKYVRACKQAEKQPVRRAMWYRCWDNYCPHIITQISDPCNSCKDFLSDFAKVKSEDTKARMLKDALDHFDFVKEQRVYYQNIISMPPEMVDMSLGPHAPCSKETLVHYSFDYLQEVSLPHYSDRSGPLQFISGYKVWLFGVAVEQLQKFVLYVIPECIFKGPNLVVSLLHHFFENFALGESHVVCHAGSSSNQNKNNVLVQYAVWRVMSKLHKSFQLSFLPDGHSKFAPDLYFGLFKKKFRVSTANSLMDVCQIAVSADDSKSTIGVIVDETGHIKIYDWMKYFYDNFSTPIPELASRLHFKSEVSGRGTLMCSITPNNCSNTVSVFDQPFDQKMPMILPPEGLSFDRQKYLYENIRKFVPLEFREFLCPIPKRVRAPIIESVNSSETPKPKIDKDLDPLDLLNTKNVKDCKGVEDELGAAPKGSLRRNSPICSYCGAVGHRNQIRQGRYYCRKRELDSEASTSNSKIKKEV